MWLEASVKLPAESITLPPWEALAEAHYLQPGTTLVYTDGGYLMSHGIGAWAFVAIPYAGAVEVQVGACTGTTNGRMELSAAKNALSAVEIGPPVHMVCDSEYVLKGLHQWLNFWPAKGWVASSGDPVKNQDVWRELEMLRWLHTLTLQHVDGHSGNLLNGVVDRLCTLTMKFVLAQGVQASLMGGSPTFLNDSLLVEHLLSSPWVTPSHGIGDALGAKLSIAHKPLLFSKKTHALNDT